MPYTRLTRDDRHTIDTLRSQGLGVREIAAEMHRSPSTISRELKRNSSNGHYCFVQADAKSLSRRPEPIRLYTSEVWNKVEDKLKVDWSPEQITGSLRALGEKVPSHETIYQHILTDKENGGELYKHLRHPVKSYRKRGLVRERRGRIKNQVMIDERPKEVEQKERIADGSTFTALNAASGTQLSVENAIDPSDQILTITSNFENAEQFSIANVQLNVIPEPTSSVLLGFGVL